MNNPDTITELFRAVIGLELNHFPLKILLNLKKNKLMCIMTYGINMRERLIEVLAFSYF